MAAQPSASGSSFGQFIIAMVVVTVLAGVIGTVVAPRLNAQSPATKEQKVEAAAEAAIPSKPNLLDLPPIVTNLGAPQETWVRLETSMVFDPTAVKQPETLAAEIANDLLAYMRTVSLTQLQGPIGLQNLRQDLNDRAAVRSNGAVKELAIRTFVLQ
jgi:flagellar protein FliL